MNILKIICITVCMICIVVGTMLTLWMIWGEVDNDIAWKSWATIGTFFFASLAALGVTWLYQGKETK